MFLQGCRLCNSYFKLRVPDLIAGCVAPISNHVYPTFYVPTLARHNNTSLPPLGSSRDSSCYSSLPAKRDLLPTRQLGGVLVQSFGASGFSRWKSSMYSDAWVRCSPGSQVHSSSGYPTHLTRYYNFLGIRAL